MPLLLSQCLVAYTFLQGTLSFLMNPLLSFFFTNLLNPHKTLPLSASLTETTMFFLFFFIFIFLFLGQKLLQSIALSPCKGQWLLLSSSSSSFFFFFFFFGQKKFAKALIAEKKFSPETIQNIDASSTFDRILWLKLQQWWFGVVNL